MKLPVVTAKRLKYLCFASYLIHQVVTRGPYLKYTIYTLHVKGIIVHLFNHKISLTQVIDVQCCTQMSCTHCNIILGIWII